MRSPALAVAWAVSLGTFGPAAEIKPKLAPNPVVEAMIDKLGDKLMWLTAWNISENLRHVGLLERWQKESRHTVPLWGYFPETNSWKPLGVEQNPTQGNNASLLCCIPELNGSIYYGKGTGSKTFLWDNRTDKWSLCCARPAEGQGPGSEMLSCYWSFDVAARQWLRPPTPNSAALGRDLRRLAYVVGLGG